MNLTRFALPLVALALLAITLGQATAPAPIPRALAVVNLNSLFEKLDEKADDDQKIENMGKDLTDQKNKKQKDLDDLSGQLSSNLFKPGSAEYSKMQDDLLLKAADLQNFRDYAQQKLYLEQRLRTLEIYRKINDAVEQYAKANGIALVFVIDDANFGGARNIDELKLAIGSRKVLYADSNYDITRKIIEKMNADRLLGPGK